MCDAYLQARCRAQSTDMLCNVITVFHNESTAEHAFHSAPDALQCLLSIRNPTQTLTANTLPTGEWIRITVPKDDRFLREHAVLLDFKTFWTQYDKIQLKTHLNNLSGKSAVF